MEGLAAGASVTGVLSLAGQTVEGIVKLHAFFKDVSSASRTIDRFLQAINQLIKLISDVKNLLERVAESPIQIGSDFKIAALKIQLEDCSRDVYKWLKLAKDHHPGFSTGTKAGFKKFWVAVNKGEVGCISEDIREHRDGIVASLSVLGKFMGVDQSTKLLTLQQTLEVEALDATNFRRNSMQKLLKIDSLEQCSRASLSYGHQSMVSLASIASSIAEIERRLSLAHIPSGNNWGSREALKGSRVHSTGAIRSVTAYPSIPEGLGEQDEVVPSDTHRNSKKKMTFTLGGSSASGDSIGSRCAAALDNPRPQMEYNGLSKRARQEIPENTNDDYGLFQSEEDDEVDSNAIDEDDDLSDWEASGGSDGHPVNEDGLKPFQLPLAEQYPFLKGPEISSTVKEIDTSVIQTPAAPRSILKKTEHVISWATYFRELASPRPKWRTAGPTKFAAALDVRFDCQQTTPRGKTGPMFSVGDRLLEYLCEIYRIEDLYHTWAAFSRCSTSIAHGRRLENLSWRILNREVFCCRKIDTSNRQPLPLLDSENHNSLTREGLTELPNYKEALAIVRDSLEERLAPASDKSRPSQFEKAGRPATAKSINKSHTGSTSVQSNDSLIERRATVLLGNVSPVYPTKVASYISRHRLLQTIEQQMSLLSLQSANNPEINQHLATLSKHLEAIKRNLTRLRAQCLMEGHSLHHIDEILNSCKLHDPATGLRLPKQDTAARHIDLLALRRRSLKHEILLGEQNYTKRDRINRWLFHNLQNSLENAALHRSMMINGTEKELDEKSWARKVVKFWSIDEAATGHGHESGPVSTNLVVGSYAESLEERGGDDGEPLQKGTLRELKMPLVIKRIMVKNRIPTTASSGIEFPFRKLEGMGKDIVRPT